MANYEYDGEKEERHNRQVLIEGGPICSEAPEQRASQEPVKPLGDWQITEERLVA